MKGCLLTSIFLRKKSHVEKLFYTVKFQEALKSSNAVSSTCFFFKKFQAAVLWNEVKHKEVVEVLNLSFNINNRFKPYCLLNKV